MRRLILAALGLVASGCFLDAVGLPPEQAGEGGSDTPVSGGESPLGGSDPVAGMGTGGEGGAAPVCGNSTLETGEGCDSGRATTGCVECQITPGYTCAGEPSLCAAIEPIAVSASFDVPINDMPNHYDGSIASMDCADLEVEDAGFTKIQWVTLQVAVNHDYLGDLVIKLVPPAGMPVATVLSRAAVAEGVDDYINLTAEASGLRQGFPITFDDTSAIDAELLGSTIVEGIACQDDGICVVHSNPDAAPGTGLADLIDQSPVGKWSVCFADADDGTAGNAAGARLTVLAW